MSPPHLEPAVQLKWNTPSESQHFQTQHKRGSQIQSAQLQYGDKNDMHERLQIQNNIIQIIELLLFALWEAHDYITMTTATTLKLYILSSSS